MNYYPINLDLQNKKVLIVGAGKIALQKLQGLLSARARVCVLAKEICEEIRCLAFEGKIILEQKAYQKEDLKGAFLVFAATNDPELNRQIHRDAQEEKILLNAVDQPLECDFIIPARVEKGDLLIAISTGGKGPFLSKLFRKYFENKFPPDFEATISSLFELRQKMIQRNKGKEFALYMERHAQEICNLLMEKPQSLLEKIEKEFEVGV